MVSYILVFQSSLIDVGDAEDAWDGGDDGVVHDVIDGKRYDVNCIEK